VGDEHGAAGRVEQDRVGGLGPETRDLEQAGAERTERPRPHPPQSSVQSLEDPAGQRLEATSCHAVSTGRADDSGEGGQGGRRRPAPLPGPLSPLQALLPAWSGPPASPAHLPIRVAEAEGYFAAAGLAVTTTTTRAESGAAEALAQGQADLAATALEAILRFGLRATNQAPRLIFGLTAAPPVALLVAGPHTS